MIEGKIPFFIEKKIRTQSANYCPQTFKVFTNVFFNEICGVFFAKFRRFLVVFLVPWGPKSLKIDKNRPNVANTLKVRKSDEKNSWFFLVLTPFGEPKIEKNREKCFPKKRLKMNPSKNEIFNYFLRFCGASWSPWTDFGYQN